MDKVIDLNAKLEDKEMKIEDLKRDNLKLVNEIEACRMVSKNTAKGGKGKVNEEHKGQIDSLKA
jgi:predicted phage tail protein